MIGTVSTAEGQKTGVHVFSVRIPEELYRTSADLAQRRQISMNALLNQALTRVIDEEMDKEMYDAATLLGMDAEMCDVEFAFPAQAEVVLGS